MWPRWPPRSYNHQDGYHVKNHIKFFFSAPNCKWPWIFVYSISDSGSIKFVQMMVLGWPDNVIFAPNLLYMGTHLYRVSQTIVHLFICFIWEHTYTGCPKQSCTFSYSVGIFLSLCKLKWKISHSYNQRPKYSAVARHVIKVVKRQLSIYHQ